MIRMVRMERMERMERMMRMVNLVRMGVVATALSRGGERLMVDNATKFSCEDGDGHIIRSDKDCNLPIQDRSQ